MNNPKRQHWVPECYLKAWRTPESAEDRAFVWRIDRETREGLVLSIKDVCVERDLYTVRSPGKPDDYGIELDPARTIERA
jgi:hypothetical protein